MIRRRPIPRSRSYPESSLRYTVSPDGSFRIYPDGREVCFDSPAGRREYGHRVKLMLERQAGRCCLCGNGYTRTMPPSSTSVVEAWGALFATTVGN